MRISLSGTRSLLHRSLMPAVAVARENGYYYYYYQQRRRKMGMVVIMGATGTGKSKLSIDVATRVGGEVVNSDKIQVYRGLDITTNKISAADRRGVPHHLLGDINPAAGELTPAGFRSLAGCAVTGIAERGRVPVVAGGSNSFIHALVADGFVPGSDPFAAARRRRWGVRSRCCFVWVDVEGELLGEYLDRRVDEMVEGGMDGELREYLERGARHVGLGKAIGVPEFGKFFRNEWSHEEAVAAVKANTRRLAAAQVGKIRKMGEEWGWAMTRVDATAAVAARLYGKGKKAEAASWERDVLGPTMEALESFLRGGNEEEEVQEEQLILPFHLRA
ncbi:adenylate isopentenyltransferase-like [Typha angustifolia]|uniref:adenylate isopentenyltransferase-like n=1 Tax=Typha angustifolia TaxID=59011 RepID=UPI003C2F26ED